MSKPTKAFMNSRYCVMYQLIFFKEKINGCPKNINLEIFF